ncbi:MAG TPA: cupin domain-containing protein [Nitrosospira sp.]
MKFRLVKSVTHVQLFAALIVASFVSMAGIASADEARSDTKGAKSVGITLMPVTAQILPDDPTQTLTAFMVYLTPEAHTTSHRHAGVVFVHVLEGTVRSQLNNGEVIEYRAGESWSEPPGSVHSFMENPSKTVPARLIATIIAPTGVKLTTYDQGASAQPLHAH